MKIKLDSRLHKVLLWIKTAEGRYCECWTEKSVEKLVFGGYIQLVEAPEQFQWGKSRTCVVTALGLEALDALKTGLKIFVPNG